MHQSILAAPSTPPPPSQATVGHLPALSFPPGVGHLQILCCLGAGHLLIPGPFPSFWHACNFQSEYNYTEDFTGEKADRLICQGWRGLWRHVLDFMYAFLHCLSSQSYIAKSGAIDLNQCFFGFWVKFLLILFEKHPFIFIKLFITYNFTVLYKL